MAGALQAADPQWGKLYSPTGVVLPVASGLTGGAAVIFTVVCSREQTRTGSAYALAGVPVEKRQTHNPSPPVTTRGDPARCLEVANTQHATPGGDAWRPSPPL